MDKSGGTLFKTRKRRKAGRRPLWLPVTALILVGLSLLFRFALVGYKAMAFLLLGLAAGCLLLFALFPCRAARWALGAAAVAVAAAIAAAEVPVIAASSGDEAVNVPYLVVLGAGVNGRTPSQSLVDRMEAALDYLTAHPDAMVIVSGGQGAGEEISEAQAMREWLCARGIAEERILTEERSASTEENLAYSFEIIRARGDDPADGVAIASSEYHLYRAKRMAAAQGATPYGVAGHTPRLSLRINYFLREAFAVWKLWLFG